MNTDRVLIYTDGACSGNPGPGGWAAILSLGDYRREISGYEPETTNNRMELLAAIRAIACLKRRCDVKLYSDSSYLVNAFAQGWLVNWQRNGWKKSDKQPVENQDLWRNLLELCAQHSVEFVKVKGHADHPENNRCDELARAAIRQARACEGGEGIARRLDAEESGGQ